MTITVVPDPNYIATEIRCDCGCNNMLLVSYVSEPISLDRLDGYIVQFTKEFDEAQKTLAKWEIHLQRVRSDNGRNAAKRKINEAKQKMSAMTTKIANYKAYIKKNAAYFALDNL